MGESKRLQFLFLNSFLLRGWSKKKDEILVMLDYLTILMVHPRGSTGDG